MKLHKRNVHPLALLVKKAKPHLFMAQGCWLRLFEDFAQLGTWLGETFRVHAIPSAGVLQGGYSSDLPVLNETFLTAWSTAHASCLAPVPY